MNFRALVSSLLDVCFPKRKRITRSWDKMTTVYFEAAAAPAAYDEKLAQLSARAIFSYTDPLVRDAIHALKYEGERRVALIFGECVTKHLQEDIADHALLSEAPLLLIPIPITFSRHIERSYNQTELIGKEVAERLGAGIEYAPQYLKRRVYTKSQTEAKTRTERAGNIRGAFTVPDDVPLAGRDVILLDDVITTGATLRETAAILYAAGAKSVSCIAIAH